MNEDPKLKLQRTLIGLKSTIASATSSGHNCHYNVGQALSLVRDEYIKLLADEDRAFVDATIAPIDFTVPKRGDLGIWTVNAAEAWRLYSQLAELIGSQPAKPSPPAAAGKSPSPANSRKIFLVHGHDEAAREASARFIEKLGYQPVILHEQANAGYTVVEKLEAHSDVRFALVLLTPDDEGRKLGIPTLTPRARQNVVLELGYFIGQLGRKNVCALYKGGVEIPSDYLGVLFVALDDAGGWRLQVAREMKAAGLDVDMNKAL